MEGTGNVTSDCGIPCAAWGGEGRLSWAHLVPCGNELPVMQGGDTVYRSPPLPCLMCLCIGPHLSPHFGLCLPAPQGNAGVSDVCYLVQPCMGDGDSTLPLHLHSALPSPMASTFDLIKSSQDPVRSLVPPAIEQEPAIQSFTLGHPNTPMPER